MVLGHRPDDPLSPGRSGDPREGVDHDQVPEALWDEQGTGGSPKHRSPRPPSPRSPRAPKTGRSPAGSSCAASPAEPRRGHGQDELFTTWRHHGFITNIHPEHRRRGRDPPRPRHHRAGHRRAEERPARTRALRAVRRQRCLARPGLPRVQRRSRRRRRRLAPTRQSPLGHPAPAADRHPRPDRVLSPTPDCTYPRTGPGRPRGRTSGPPPPPPDHPARPAPRNTHVEEPDRPATARTPAAANDNKNKLRDTTRPPKSPSVDQGSGVVLVGTVR